MNNAGRLGIAVGISGGAVAAFGPTSWFRWFIEHVVGGESGPALGVTLEQRIIATCGAGLAALGMLGMARRRAGVLVWPDTRLLAVVAVPFTALIVINIWWAGARHGLWRWPAPVVTASYRPLTYALGALTLLSMFRPVVRARMYRPTALLPGIVLGAAYGFFSALWHCCPALWDTGPQGGVGQAVSAAGFLIMFSLAGLGLLTAVATRWAAPWGELAGGLLLAAFYPWHTPAWALQCVAGGALCTQLARRTASYLTPGLFLSTAYLTHMTVPFLDWAGATIAAIALATLGFAAWRTGDTAHLPAS